MKKKTWKAWDELLIEAWKRDASMFQVAFNFLLLHSQITLEQLRSSGPEDLFAAIGVTSRSPKFGNHLNCPVKEFFRQFFPDANELLWQGKDAPAKEKLRLYRVSEERLSQGRELNNLKTDARRKRSSLEFPLIPGTNAMHIRDARKSASDWNTVKPSRARQRTRPL